MCVYIDVYISGRPRPTAITAPTSSTNGTLDFKITHLCSIFPGVFCVLRGRNSAQIPMEFRCVFPILQKKKIPIFKKNIYIFEDRDFYSITTHTSYMVTIYYHNTLFLLHVYGKSRLYNISKEQSHLSSHCLYILLSMFSCTHNIFMQIQYNIQ